MLTKKKSRVEMLSGNLFINLCKFSLPLAAASLLQLLFSSADLVVVGQYAGSDALAAVGANSPVINLLVNLFVGLSTGSNVVISKYIGMENHDGANKAAHTSIVISILSGIFLMIIGVALADPIMALMNVPETIEGMAAEYLRIYFLGMPFIMLYNFASSIFRSKGDTKTPLIVLFIAGLINVGLNFFFVLSLGMDVDGVAIATVLSNVVSSVTLVVILFRSNDMLKLSMKKMRINKNILIQIVKIGVPSGLQGAVFSVSNILIQTATNGLGSTAVAASTTAGYYEMYSYCFANAFGQAAVTFSGQNFGAGNLQRCRQVTRWSLFLGCASSFIAGFIFAMLPNFFAGIYTTDAAVIELVAERLRIVVIVEFLNTFDDVFAGVLRVYGRTLLPTILYIGSICGVRIFWIYAIFVLPGMHTLTGLSYAYPVSWIVTSLLIMSAYFLSIRKMPGMLKTKTV